MPNLPSIDPARLAGIDLTNLRVVVSRVHKYLNEVQAYLDTLDRLLDKIDPTPQVGTITPGETPKASVLSKVIGVVGSPVVSLAGWVLRRVIK